MTTHREAVDVTRHPRTRVFGAGVFLAVLGGSLLLAPTPALAAKPTVSIGTLGSGNLRSGETTRLTFTVTNNAGEDPSPSVRIEVSGFDQLRCTGQCNFIDPINPGQSKEYSVDLVAGNVDPGDKKSGTVTITATTTGTPGGGDTGKASAPVTVQGPDAVQRIDGLKGKVRDEFGAAVPGATVAYLDSRNGRGETTSGGDGSFSFPSTDDKPIAPGAIQVGASKEGFKNEETTVNGKPGRAVTANLKLASAAAATPSPTPSASAETSAEAAEEPSAEPAAAAPTVDSTPAGSVKDDEGSSSLLFILGGGLLVAVGIGAMVLLFIKRKEKDPEDDDADLPAVPAAAVPTPTRYGTAGANPTRVAAPRAGGPAVGPAPDATMVTTGAVPPSLANAQTMLQPAVPADDEFPDPYGAPRPASGTRTQTWNAAAVPGAVPGQATPPAAPGATYGAATIGGTGVAGAAGVAGQYGRPAPADPYEAPAPGGTYGAQPAGAAYGVPQAGPRYDEPTGRYNPDADQPAGAYGAAAPRQPGHGADQPYGGQGAAYGSGVDAAGTGYGSTGAAGTYGAPAQPRYDEPTTYGRPAGGYEQGGGTYGRPAEPPPYDARPGQRGGYEEPGHYGAEQPPPHGRRGDADQHGYDAEEQPQQRGGPYTGGQYGTGPGGDPGRPGGQRRSLDWLDD